MPANEVAFRRRPDGRGHTWAKLSLEVQVTTFGRYLALSLQTAGWSRGPLDAFFELARRAVARIDRTPEMESIPGLLTGQRIANGIAKIAFSRARRRKASLYHAVGPCPYPHLEPTDLHSDAVFCHLRLAGLNPVLVETVDRRERVAECAPLADVEQEFRRAGHGEFEGAVAEGRLTVVAPEAFAPLEHLRATDEPEHPYEPRFFCRPTAVFVRRAGESHLRPVAIRCAPSFATITPAHGQVWERAKLHFQVADSLYHTFVSHLPQTHFLLEPVVLATRNALGFDHVGAQHPVRRLLEPHLEGTLAVNRVARSTLLDGSSSFRQFVAADVASTTAMMSAAFTERAQSCVTTFDAKHLGEVDRGLVCPYRDDFERVRAPLVEWIDAYVDMHYGSDADVCEDVLLQRWSEHLRDPARGRLTGLPPLRSVRSLQRTLATIVELATLQHASFHFPQTDLGRLAYVIPFYAADVPPGQCMAEESELTLLDSLPDLHAAAWQSFVLGQSDLRWSSLQDLPGRHDGHARALAEGMWRRLEGVEQQIVARNAALVRDGLTPYEYLQPSKVPCSVNT
ncbi:MAG: lipoxygenase family protein [Myxococcota bacterium]